MRKSVSLMMIQIFIPFDAIASPRREKEGGQKRNHERRKSKMKLVKGSKREGGGKMSQGWARALVSISCVCVHVYVPSTDTHLFRFRLAGRSAFPLSS